MFFLESKNKSTLFCTKIPVKLIEVLASKCTSLRRKPVQRNYQYFFKLKLLMKILLIEVILGSKLNMNQITTKKLCFGYFCRFVIRASTLRLRNMYICLFRWGTHLYVSLFLSIRPSRTISQELYII